MSFTSRSMLPFRWLWRAAVGHVTLWRQLCLHSTYRPIITSTIFTFPSVMLDKNCLVKESMENDRDEALMSYRTA